MAQTSYHVGDLCKILQKSDQPDSPSENVKLTKEKKKLQSLFANSVSQANASVSKTNEKKQNRDKTVTAQLTQQENVGDSAKKKKKKKKGDENITMGATSHSPGTPVKKHKLPLSKSTKKKKKRKEESESSAGEGREKVVSKKRKRKSDAVEEEEAASEPQTGATSLPGYNPPPGVVHEALAAATPAAQKHSKTKKRKLKESDDEMEAEDVMPAAKTATKEAKKSVRKRRDRLHKGDNPRTVFIGNVPIATKKTKLLKMFKAFGEVESLRYRCLPPKNPNVPKKVVAIKKEFHPERQNCVAYIRFKEEEAAHKALSLNGECVDGLHIRVDMASREDKAKRAKYSVFVGNIPFDAEEEAVRKHFDDCGKIEDVRIIRDSKYGIGKGFCYVNFSDTDGAMFALKLHGSEFKGRQLRVVQCHANPTKGTTEKQHKFNKSEETHFKPSNKSKQPFQGMQAQTKTKRKKRKDFKKKRESQIDKQTVNSGKSNFGNTAKKMKDKPSQIKAKKQKLPGGNSKTTFV